MKYGHAVGQESVSKYTAPLVVQLLTLMLNKMPGCTVYLATDTGYWTVVYSSAAARSPDKIKGLY